LRAVTVYPSPKEKPDRNSETRRLDMWATFKADTKNWNPPLIIYEGTSGKNPEPLAGFNQEKASAGVVKLDEDRLGYTLEYRIKWRDLWKESDPAGEGIVRAVCWDVRWSDPTGKVLLAKHSDVLKPDMARTVNPETFLSYEHPELWGQATFHRK
jgi:hypothetical protein